MTTIKERQAPPEGPATQSPIEAAPGETADAVPPPPGHPISKIGSPPAITLQEEQAITALKAFRCNRLGIEMPEVCDGLGDSIEKPAMAGFAEHPDASPKEWAGFEIERTDPELARIFTERCQPKRGVINDVFVATTDPNRQGAASMTGSLAANSTNANCP